MQVKAAIQGTFGAVNNYSQELQSQDKPGNPKIQTLMSNCNEAQTTLANIEKTAHDTKSTGIGKL